MKKIIFLFSMVYLPMLIAMKKDKEKEYKEYLAKSTTITLCTESTNAFDNEIPLTLARLKIPQELQQIRPNFIVDIFPLLRTGFHLKKKFGETIVINQIPLPLDNQQDSLEFNYSPVDAVISLANLHCLRNQQKKELFASVAENLIKNGQLLFCISAKLDRHHPINVAFNKLKEKKGLEYLYEVKLKNIYHYITEKKAESYLQSAGLSKLEITPYTRSIIFQNKEVFTDWIFYWMSTLPVFKNAYIEKRIAAVRAFADFYLLDNPVNLDGSINYSYPYLLIHAEKK